jgi:[ribosomal protein S5]-alanine N-acetyltransferase
MQSLRDLYGPLETPRLHLREPQEEHAPLIFEAFASDAEVTRFLRWRPQRSIEEAQLAMAQRLQRLREACEFSWIIFRVRSASLVGIVSLWPSGETGELGFALARDTWGQGLAKEAVGAVLDWALQRACLERVWAACDVENVRSQRVLEKLGMVRERSRLSAVHPNLSPAPRECFVYAAVGARCPTSGCS